MILIDAEGNKIVAGVKKFLFDDFEQILVEGNYCVIENFGVQPYKEKYKLVDHSCKVNFYRLTKAQLTPPFNIDTYGFNPVIYDDLLELKFKITDPIDVVGQLNSIQNLMVKTENGNDTKSIDFVLQDVSGKRISCTVWGDHATQLADFVSGYRLEATPIVMLIHNGKLSKWRDLPQVSNQLFGCRIFINEDLDPIAAFRKTLQEIATDDVRILELPKLDLTPVVKTALDDFKEDPTVTIEEVRSIMQVSYCVSKAVVVKIFSEDGWFSFGCRSCGKKAGNRVVVPGGERVHECDTCGRVSDVYSKVRLTIRVKDRSGSTSFVLFETQLAKMLKRSVTWLTVMMDKVADPTVIPDEFGILLTKQFVFRVRISSFNLDRDYPSYTIDKVTEDLATLDYVGEKLETKLAQFPDNNPLLTTSNAKVPMSLGCDPKPTSDTEWTPETDSLKRKSESPPDPIDLEGSTSSSKTVQGLASLKIPRMEDI